MKQVSSLTVVFVTIAAGLVVFAHPSHKQPAQHFDTSRYQYAGTSSDVYLGARGGADIGQALSAMDAAVHRLEIRANSDVRQERVAANQELLYELKRQRSYMRRELLEYGRTANAKPLVSMNIDRRSAIQ